MNVASVMTGLGSRLSTITGLRVFSYAPDTLSPPAAVVALPESIEFDSTMARGADRMSIPMHLLVGRVSDRSSTTELAAYLSGTGTKSIKAAIEGDRTLSGSCDSARVTEAATLIMQVSGNDYLAATFTIDVIG